jgi:dTDP-L-rhamnose 4-epimerase
MSDRILITGGAGFIGSHLARRLVRAGCSVRVLDSMVPQVHGHGEVRPPYLDEQVELMIGDIRDVVLVRRALENVDRVVHLAARVGVGQSMYEIAEYMSVNTVGTSVLLEALAERPVEQLVVASSMSVYGEGLYRDETGNDVATAMRDRALVTAGVWNPVGGGGACLTPVPTPEWKPVALTSPYALGKYDQERLCLIAGEAYGIPTVALRLFNVYGPDQALSNPYTGVLAIFAAQLLNGRAPMIFEDGLQRRDFVSVHDVAAAFHLALTSSAAAGSVINIGSGRDVTVQEVAAQLARLLGRDDLVADTTGTYRVGDVRHCFADVRRAHEVLGYQPAVELEAGMAELAEWLATQVAIDRVDAARHELERRGLTV